MMINLKKEQMQSLSYPSWKRVGNIDFEGFDNIEKNGTTAIDGLQVWQSSGVKIYKITSEDKDLEDVFWTPYKELLNEFEEVRYGSDKKLVLQAETEFNTGHLIVIPEGIILERPLMIHYRVNSASVDQTVIFMGKSSKAVVSVVYEDDNGSYHNGLIKVYGKDDSRLDLSIVQLFSDQTVHIQNTVSLLGRNTQVNLTTIDFGSALFVSDYSAYLNGQSAMSEVNSAYLGEHDRKIDIGYNTYHKGMRSESVVECKGALMDRSKKVFRGNLRFLNGAKRSKGRESEYVLLLDEQVQSDAIPALLCDEDDVSGEHAASAGQVNMQQLFYLMSRGFSLKEAKKLIIHGSFSKVIDLLPTVELKERVEEELERRLIHAGEAL